ncbi:MAG TPA: NAD(P)-binding domain-containing protein [Vicinamibacterales bacterium]|nr:NAD(P)-binding domain-containing protein [Vicinamibacterales bacterium]
MRVGIVGAGMIGSTVGRLLADAGHHVQFASRHPERLATLIADIGSNATAATVAETVRFGEAMLFAVPLLAWPTLAPAVRADLAGKTVLDSTNPYQQRDGALARTVIDGGGTGVYLSKLLPEVGVVRAFNTVHYKTLQEQAHRAGERLAVALAGDDSQPLAIAAGLVRDAGFEPVIVGPLRDARRFDVGTSVYNKALTAAELRRALGIAATA